VRLRRIKNTFASYGMMVLTGVCGLIVFVIGLGLYFKARPILEAKGIRDLLFRRSGSRRKVFSDFGLLLSVRSG